METALQLLREQGMLRPRDLTRHDIPPDYLDRLHRLGLVDRVARGLYAWPDAEVSEHHSLAEAARLVPGGGVPALGAAVPRADHPVTPRGVAHPPEQGMGSEGQVPEAPDLPGQRPGGSPRWSRDTGSKGSL